MRFHSATKGGLRVFAVTGVNTVSFGIEADAAARKGLLGFAVERFDPTENERYIMPGYKVFSSLVPEPNENTVVSTWEHPVQSFVWDDFTAKPDRTYEYKFYPLKGKPKNLDRSGTPAAIRVKTEQLYSDQEHDVFFNRGVASSQAYHRKFGNLPPDSPKLSKKEQGDALQWLTRDLDDAIFKFIGSAKRGDTLLCCFYEFHYQPIVDALAKAAINSGVDVELIIDAKDNATTDKDGVRHPAFPREENLKAIAAARFPEQHLTLRQACASYIQHNKFMVLLRGASKKPTAVWTGSTNISLGGIAGQTNVGHWVRNAAVAEAFRDYWNVLARDPGARKGDDRAAAAKANGALRAAVGKLGSVPTSVEAIPAGVTCVFSPRQGLKVLDLYGAMLDWQKARCSCITLAFGVNKVFKDRLRDNDANSPVTFMLLEKPDKPGKKNTDTFVALNAKNNVYEAYGSYIQDPIYQWAKEVNTAALGLNTHVMYVHSKFMLVDPLGANPVVVTGSANFSAPSTNANDENMLLIRGNQRVADIYFTEFNRLFNHYYFRSALEDAKRRERSAGASKKPDVSLFLDETPAWLEKYKPGKLRAKRLNLFKTMKGSVQL